MLEADGLHLFGPDVDPARLDEVCRRYGIASLSVFGSFARGDAVPTSDLDLLYDLQPGARLGWEIEDLVAELSALLGRPVDLLARRALHPLLRDDVLEAARPVYAA